MPDFISCMILLKGSLEKCKKKTLFTLFTLFSWLSRKIEALFVSADLWSASFEFGTVA